MRVRCSAGLDVDCYWGSFYRRPTNPTDVDLPAIDCDKALVAKVQHVDKLASGGEAYFQAAMLYTTTEGARRIRVSRAAGPQGVLPGALAAWRAGCLARWLPGALAAWRAGCLARWLPGGLRPAACLCHAVGCPLLSPAPSPTTTPNPSPQVHTLALPVSDSMSSIFKGADLDAQLAVLTRQAAIQVPGSSLHSVKEVGRAEPSRAALSRCGPRPPCTAVPRAARRPAAMSHPLTPSPHPPLTPHPHPPYPQLVTSRAVATLHSYRRYCATSSSSVQLILPEALKLLPLYSLGLAKSAGLRADVRPDERAAWLAAAMSATCAALTPMLYGRLVPVTKLLQQSQGGAEPQLGWLPDGAILSSEVFEAGGVYLLENGRDALVYVDKAAPAAVWQEVAGVGSAEELARAPGPVQLVARDAPLSRLLQALLVRVRQQRCAYMRLRLVRKGEAAEAAFLHGLVEDRGAGGSSYVEHLCHVHRLIQGKMG
jgi:hypothetical protein